MSILGLATTRPLTVLLVALDRAVARAGAQNAAAALATERARRAQWRQEELRLTA